MWADSLAIYRFDGEIAVPTSMFARKSTSWLWRDRNGDGKIQTTEYEILGKDGDSLWGWEIDSNGDIWQASRLGKIYHYRFQGLDTYDVKLK